MIRLGGGNELSNSIKNRTVSLGKILTPKEWLCRMGLISYTYMYGSERN